MPIEFDQTPYEFNKSRQSREQGRVNGGPVKPGSMYRLGGLIDQPESYHQGQSPYLIPKEPPEGFLIIHGISKEDYERAIKDRPVSMSVDVMKIRNTGLGAGWVTDADGVPHLVEVSAIPNPDIVMASRWGIDPSGKLSETREPIEYTAPWTPATAADIFSKFGKSGIPTSRFARMRYRVRAFFRRLFNK